MQVRANAVVIFFHEFDKLARHFRCLDARKPHSDIRNFFANLPNKMGKPRPFRFGLTTVEVHSIMSEMDTRQDDLSKPVIAEPRDFVQYLLNGPAEHVWHTAGMMQ